MANSKNAVELAIQHYKFINNMKRGEVSDIAKKLGCSRTTVQTWCRQGYVSIDYLEKFSQLTECRPIDLNPVVQRLATM